MTTATKESVADKNMKKPVLHYEDVHRAFASGVEAGKSWGFLSKILPPLAHKGAKNFLRLPQDPPIEGTCARGPRSGERQSCVHGIKLPAHVATAG